jgi:hypothetical protein
MHNMGIKELGGELRAKGSGLRAKSVELKAKTHNMRSNAFAFITRDEIIHKENNRRCALEKKKGGCGRRAAGVGLRA